MAPAAKSLTVWHRRAVLGLVLAWPVAALAPAQTGSAAILVVSRKRLLNETQPARNLLESEIKLTAELQRRVDAIKAQLTAEEEELAQLRTTMAREVFEARVAEFDRKVRRERRQTQHRAAALQTAFREARLLFVEALGPVLEEVRVARGAAIILNAEQVLVADPAVDVTDEVIARINATVPTPPIPDLDRLDPGPETPLEIEDPDAGSQPGSEMQQQQ